MTRPWWESDHPDRSGLVPDRDLSDDREDGSGQAWRRPRVHEQQARAIAAEALERRGGFTPTWTSTRDDDAGRVLIDLFSQQVAATATSINDSTLKARVDLLATAGIGPLPPRPLRTLLAFTVSQSAPRSVPIGAGFRVIGKDTDGRDVSFETEDTIVASPGELTAAVTEIESVFEKVELPSLPDRVTVLPFGTNAPLDSAFYIGIAGPVSPFPELSLAWFAAPRGESPPPASAGTKTLEAEAQLPVLTWELLDGIEVVPAELLSDETSSLTRTGVVRLRTPMQWRPTTIPNGGTTPLRWLRVRITQGQYRELPIIAHVALNAVWSTSGETIRREVLTPVAQPGERARVFQLARTPVLAKPDGTTSLDLRIDEGEAQPTQWTERPDVSTWKADDRVYRLDPISGVVEFGDGVRGRQIPDGFRHVRAASYRAYVPASRIAAGAITSPAGSAPFVVGATNPVPVAATLVVETLARTLYRGRDELAARGRAVTAADYQVMALRAPGADVRRVQAEPGFNPRAPGRRVPGVVGMLVVAGDRFDGKPPIPDEQSLQAVVDYLAEAVAPAGVEVIAAAPTFVSVSADLSFVPEGTSFDTGEIVNELIRRINLYLHPLTGGDWQTGWPFGGKIRPVALVRALLENNAMVRSIPRLTLAVDGVRYIDCVEVVIPPRALLWPSTHRAIPMAEEDVK